MKYWSLYAVILSGILNFSCTEPKAPPQKSPAVSVEDLSVEEFKVYISDNSEQEMDIIVLDVRTPREYQAGNVPNSVNIDYLDGNFATEISKLDTSVTYLVYCQSGRRSAAASEMMVEELGFRKVKNLLGGYPSLITN